MFHSSKFVEFVQKMVGMPYWYGTCVYVCSASLLNSKSKQYPDHYGSSRMTKYRNAIQAKLVCADCVGLIKGYFWTNGGQGVIEYINGGEAFTNKYASNGCPDKSANGMLSWCKSKGCKNGKIATLPDVPGVLLFSSGHVGVYIGGGYAVEARGFNYGIVKTKVKDRSWTEWAYLPSSLLEYDTADGVVVPVSEPVISTPKAYKLGDRNLKRTSPNMSGDDIRELQTSLNALGFDCGTVDGVFGKNTEKGVKAFQTACNIEVDGIFGKNSKTALDALLKAPAPPVEEIPATAEPKPESEQESEPEQEPAAIIPTMTKIGNRTLKRTSPNMKGDDVHELQTVLNALGYDCGTVDGIFGKNTEKGVKAFQKACGIEVDGIFGKESRASLNAVLKSTVTPVEEEPAPATPEPADTTISAYPIHGFIPDISAYQVAIDMDKFVAGNDFAILRARVNGKNDTKFAGWAKELNARGFPFAVYDYLRLKSEQDAIEQADAMFSACYPYKPHIYYLDTEELADGVTYAQEREYIKVYVRRLREWGVECIGQYCGDYRWRTQYRDIESIFDTLWIAHWGKNSGVYEGQTLKSASYTDKIALHQYTSYGYTKVAGAPGIDHRIDLNRLTGAKPLSWFTGRTYEE